MGDPSTAAVRDLILIVRQMVNGKPLLRFELLADRKDRCIMCAGLRTGSALDRCSCEGKPVKARNLASALQDLHSIKLPRSMRI